jgi:GntR family transcriptional regulator
MRTDWNGNEPIYRQLRGRVIALILEGTLEEGEALSSVRTVAAEHGVNPLTVLKTWQILHDEGLVEKRRGRGMFVSAGARARLLDRERQRFLSWEWPEIVERMQRLDLDPQVLLQS